ncbi:hypothetical protein OG948_56365 (plasmid) [Embleya sp. NBC_00888]|uniref:hypothetical protein n=1 Tax=Embleya sp. NBC_00888 TaxID=2975960 RepID=UPI002F9150F6|nr:hypothetical protein OG948_56365 [Embleya sp. NBC_00888]
MTNSPSLLASSRITSDRQIRDFDVVNVDGRPMVVCFAALVPHERPPRLGIRAVHEPPQNVAIPPSSPRAKTPNPA